MASAAKAAAFAAMLRVLLDALPNFSADYRPVVWTLAVLTVGVCLGWFTRVDQWGIDHFSGSVSTRQDASPMLTGGIVLPYNGTTPTWERPFATWTWGGSIVISVLVVLCSALKASVTVNVAVDPAVALPVDADSVLVRPTFAPTSSEMVTTFDVVK